MPGLFPFLPVLASPGLLGDSGWRLLPFPCPLLSCTWRRAEPGVSPNAWLGFPGQNLRQEKESPLRWPRLLISPGEAVGSTVGPVQWTLASPSECPALSPPGTSPAPTCSPCNCCRLPSLPGLCCVHLLLVALPYPLGLPCPSHHCPWGPSGIWVSSGPGPGQAAGGECGSAS